MTELERRLAERYPHWFQGQRARFARPLLRGCYLPGTPVPLQAPEAA